MSPLRFPLAALLVLTLLAACGSAESELVPDRQAGGESLSIPLPAPRVQRFAVVEDLSARAAEWLRGLEARVLRRDFAGVRGYLAPGFRGHDVFRAPVLEETGRPLGARRLRHEPRAEVVSADGFVTGLRTRLGPWRAVRGAHLSVREAEFARDGTWGRLLVGCELLGNGAGGGREALWATFHLRVATPADGAWSIDRLELLALESEAAAAPLFVEVARAAGVAHEGARYGSRAGEEEGWNGAAAGDVDGDGLLDLFVPSTERSFLYLNNGDGTFREEAGERGLAADAGGTGAVFLDYDADGDEDLFVAHVGHEAAGAEPAAEGLRLYENFGRGRFLDVTRARDIELRRPVWSLTAFDHDGDGWVDLFACGYGRMLVERNDSWIEASNGASNTLLRNVRGARFEDVTRTAGLSGERWSHAAAAADFDQDGDQDLFVANNFGSNRLWRNDGRGRFEDAARGLGVAERDNAMGAVWADWNGDGRLDLFTTAPTSHTKERVLARLARSRSARILADVTGVASGNGLYLGGERRFERSSASGAEDASWAWSSATGDFDLDGRLDLFCVNGFVTGDQPRDT